MNKALFLDRDGVLNYEKGDHTYTKEDFIILPHVAEALKAAQDKGYLLIVISNQSGIDKGLFTFETVEMLHQILVDTLKKSGVKITEIYYSPYYPEVTKSLSRKPDSIMIEKAIARFKLDKKSCLMIGDRQRDVDAAEKAGIKGVLVESNSDLREILKYLA